MKTAIMVNRTVILAGSTVVLGVAALSFTGSAHARDDVFWSVGVGAPGVSLNVGNGGPLYMQAQPIYVQPAPIYYQPQPVYYARPHGWNRRHGGHYVQAPRPGYGAGYYGPGYASVSQAYYQPEGRKDKRHDGRHEDRR